MFFLQRISATDFSKIFSYIGTCQRGFQCRSLNVYREYVCWNSSWVGDDVIDTKQSCDQQLGPFTQQSGKPGSFTQHPGGRKTCLLLQKVNLSTPHDNMID